MAKSASKAGFVQVVAVATLYGEDGITLSGGTVTISQEEAVKLAALGLVTLPAVDVDTAAL